VAGRTSRLRIDPDWSHVGHNKDPKRAADDHRAPDESTFARRATLARAFYFASVGRRRSDQCLDQLSNERRLREIRSTETMPVDTCIYLHDCAGCGPCSVLRQVTIAHFGSYGSVPCPSIQTNASCCNMQKAAER
jgi:hypothetical protein